MGVRLDYHRTKVQLEWANQGTKGGKLDCHRTKGVTRMGQWEVNQIVTEQKV